MAITWSVTILKKTTYGDEQIVMATLTSSGTYTTGGDSVTPASVGLAYIDYCDTGPALAPAGGATAFVSNLTPGAGENVAAKLQLYATGGAAQAAFPELTGGTTVTNFSILAEFRGV